ncbi:hypothetical protein CBL_12322 [Carabus blaptoides fortunei]
MPKRKYTYNDEYTQEWSFIKRGRDDYEVKCELCNVYISISHSGKSDVKTHINIQKHKIYFSGSSTSKKLDSFVYKTDSAKGDSIAASDNVVIQNPTTRFWHPAKVEKPAKHPRSYLLRRENDTIVRRNTAHIRKSNCLKEFNENASENDPLDCKPGNADNSSTHVTSSSQINNSKPVVKR